MVRPWAEAAVVPRRAMAVTNRSIERTPEGRFGWRPNLPIRGRSRRIGPDTLDPGSPYDTRPSQWSLAVVKPILGLAVTGVVGLLLWKILLGFLLPFVGIAVGFAFLIAKVVFI